MNRFRFRCACLYHIVLLLIVGISGCNRCNPENVDPHGTVDFNTIDNPEPLTAGGAPFFQEQPFDAIPGKIGHHAATITALDEGTLLAAWYAYEGPHELDGAAIYLSRHTPDSGQWETPRLHIDRPAGDGNPVLYAEGDRVWMFQAIAVGGWSTAHTEFQISEDRGVTWSSPRLLPAPLANNVRYPPVRTADGYLLLPAYGDLIYESRFFRSADGENWELASVVTTNITHPCIQPSVVRLADDRLLAVMRNTGQEWLWVTASSDHGRSWAPPVNSGFANPGSAAVLHRLNNGRLILVFNDSPDRRSPLTIAISADEGRSWPHRRNIVTGDQSYSYPSVTQTPDGLIHILYSHGREMIRHIKLNEDWILTGR